MAGVDHHKEFSSALLNFRGRCVGLSRERRSQGFGSLRLQRDRLAIFTAYDLQMLISRHCDDRCSVSLRKGERLNCAIAKLLCLEIRNQRIFPERQGRFITMSEKG